MMGIRLFVVSVAVVAAGCGDDQTTTITCGTGTSGSLAVDSPVEVTGEGGADLRGAAIAAQAKTTLPAGDVTIECAADIVPAGYTALGPAVTFGADGTWSDRPFILTLPYKAERYPKLAHQKDVRIVAKRAGQDAPFFPPETGVGDEPKLKGLEAVAERKVGKARLTLFRLPGGPD